MGLENRKKMTYRNHDIYVAPVKYVIIKKLEYFSEGGSQKHLDDIASILDVTTGEIDHQFLEEKLNEFHLQMEWEKVEK